MEVMINMKSVKVNFIYNVFYQILALLIPFITIPYASRVLGVNGIGQYSYTYSIVYYFMIIGMLGITNYGSREIAKVRDQKELMNYKFCSIYYMQLLFSLLISIVYLIFIFLSHTSYRLLFAIQLLYLLSVMVDINWFFYGIEDFKITVTRNSMIKILSLVLIFLFVNDKNDTPIYTLILSGSTLISNLLLLFFLNKHVKFEKVKMKDIFKHFYPCLILFIPVVAMKIYKVMDKTMIGLLTNVTEVGYYSNADGIINMPMGIIVALGVVMLPRLTNLISNGKSDEASNMFLKSFNLAIFMASPIMFGLMAVGKDFSILFLGNNFIKTGILVQILSITILFMTISNVLRTQFLIPHGKDKEYIIAIIAGAIVNVTLNLIFIPKFGGLGACIGTVCAEFLVMFFHIYFSRKYINIIKLMNSSIWFVFSGFLMFISVFMFRNLINNQLIKVFLQILLGMVIYFLLNFHYIRGFIKSIQSN